MPSLSSFFPGSIITPATPCKAPIRKQFSVTKVHWGHHVHKVHPDTGYRTASALGLK